MRLNTQRPVTLLRANASAEIGGGHVMRCLALGVELANSGCEVNLAVGRGSLAAIPALARSGLKVIELGCEGDVEDPTTLARAFGRACDVLIVDSYAHSARHEAAWRSFARYIVAIDDLANRLHDCDLLINQAMGLSADVYLALVPSGCRVLLGPDFAMLRPEFLLARDGSLARRANSVRTDRLAISFGMTDSLGASVRVLDELAAARVPVAVDILMGPSSPHLAGVGECARRHPFPATLIIGAEDVASVLAKCDVCVGAGGASSWERCCLGVPSILIALADNQLPNARQLAAAGAAIDLGILKDVRKGAIADALQSLIEGEHAHEKLAEMAMRAAALCDGAGTARVRAAIQALDSGRLA